MPTDVTTAGMDAFLRESLAIEGIHRAPTQAEINATYAFLTGDLDVDAVIALQAVYAPGMPLRDQPGMNVRVGRYVAPPGGTHMRNALAAIMGSMASPYKLHIQFELLHPFQDGNGRTGRAVWAAAMLEVGQDPFALGFLHRFYYQTLENAA